MNDDPSARVESQVRKLEAEEGRLLAQVKELRARLRGMREALALIRGETLDHSRSGSSKSGSRVPDPSRSPSWAFVFDLLMEAPEDGYHIDYLIETAKQFGHDIQRPTLRSNLSHAAREGIITRVSYGYYRAVRNEEPPDVNASGGSEISSGDAGSPGEFPRQDRPDDSTPSSSTLRRDLLSGTALPVGFHATTERR